MTILSNDSLEYDPELSFSDGSQGEKNKSLITDCGTEIEIPNVIWMTGKEAYDFVRDKNGNRLTSSTLIEEANILERGVEKTFDIFEEGIQLGLVKFEEGGDSSGIMGEIRNSISLRYKIQFINGAAETMGAEPPLGIAEHQMCCLINLNEVPLALRVGRDDPNWLLEIFDEMKDCVSDANIQIEIDKSASKQAKKAAKARHNETNELREFAIDYFNKHKPRLSNTSRIAAAREISRQIPITERAIDGWLKEHLQPARKE